MKSKLLNIQGAELLSRDAQKTIVGSGKGNPDLSLCGCDCAGSVTGPWYCSNYIACPQVYTCQDEI